METQQQSHNTYICTHVYTYIKGCVLHTRGPYEVSVGADVGVGVGVDVEQIFSHQKQSGDARGKKRVDNTRVSTFNKCKKHVNIRRDSRFEMCVC